MLADILGYNWNEVLLPAIILTCIILLNLWALKKLMTEKRLSKALIQTSSRVQARVQRGHICWLEHDKHFRIMFKKAIKNTNYDGCTHIYVRPEMGRPFVRIYRTSNYSQALAILERILCKIYPEIRGLRR